MAAVERGHAFHAAAAAAAATPRDFDRLARQVQALAAPGWLGEVAWPFPAWRPARPFDWAADDPTFAAAPDRWHQGDRRRFEVWLRDIVVEVA